MSEEYENIKNKLKKLLALAERGVQGEAENARKLLEKLCKEYGVAAEQGCDVVAHVLGIVCIRIG